jgi:hypothetical protein
MFIPDPGSEFYSILDPDPWVKKHRVSDPQYRTASWKSCIQIPTRIRVCNEYGLATLRPPHEKLNEVLDSVLWITSAFVQMEAFCWIRCSGE